VKFRSNLLQFSWSLNANDNWNSCWFTINMLPHSIHAILSQIPQISTKNNFVYQLCQFSTGVQYNILNLSFFKKKFFFENKFCYQCNWRNKTNNWTTFLSLNCLALIVFFDLIESAKLVCWLCTVPVPIRSASSKNWNSLFP